jgi:hypothetical protein
LIVDAVPRTRIIISEVWRPLLALFIWDVIVTVAYYVLPFKAPSLPLTLFGTALALFLGFRTNSAYQRWWEGRQLWGLMINASRNIARSARNFLPDPEAHDMKRSIVLRQIAYVNAAASCASSRSIPRCCASCRAARRSPRWRGPTPPTGCSTALAAGSTMLVARAGSTPSSRLRWNRCWSTSPIRRAAWSG